MTTTSPATCIPLTPDFWGKVAAHIAGLPLSGVQAWASLRILVPQSMHAQSLRKAWYAERGMGIVPPMMTLSEWLQSVPPLPNQAVATSQSERLMRLYAQLREHDWLKRLFSAHQDVDVLPLAQVLQTLFDELSQVLLPRCWQALAQAAAPNAAEQAAFFEARWQAALAALPLPARQLLSDEAQLVWTLWKSQVDNDDPTAVRLAALQHLAQHADAPLVWIGFEEADPMTAAFLAAWEQSQTVWRILPDWQAGQYAAVWPESCGDVSLTSGGSATVNAVDVATPNHLALCAAPSLEALAQQSAQRVLAWLQAGYADIAIIAQDRMAARRLRALLERACVTVHDEGGWKLSTTRAAAAVEAWCTLIASQASTPALADFLQSPFTFAQQPEYLPAVSMITTVLRRQNIAGGWRAISEALHDVPMAQGLFTLIANEARHYAGLHTLSDWLAITETSMAALGMTERLQGDEAGCAMLGLLQKLPRNPESDLHHFRFAEWHALLRWQMEETSFIPQRQDARVTMLPLTVGRLRQFDAVLILGADAAHLPAPSHEVLFFANAVRHELGLRTREAQRVQQLRELIAVLQMNDPVVLSWAAQQQGEPNLPSPWIARLQIALERAGQPALPSYQAEIPLHAITPAYIERPAPSAPSSLPEKLSASAYATLVNCPYRFFAERLLRLSAVESLSDMPKKRDYGEWLHAILYRYHTTVRDQSIPVAERSALLTAMTEEKFAEEIAHHAAALGYYVRWKKAQSAYLDWAAAQEAEGWQFAEGEVWCEQVLAWQGGQITLHGRIDRIDRHQGGEHRILDYKTTTASTLRARIAKKEDHQLAFYGNLLGDQPTQAAYVALELSAGKTGMAEADAYPAWQQALRENLLMLLESITHGARLPAQGVESVCQYCTMRGVCRKGEW